MSTSEMKHGAIATLLHEAMAAIADDLNARLAALQADPELSPEDRSQLSQAVRARALVELGHLAGVAGVDQAALARVLAEFAGPVPGRAGGRLKRPWWQVWVRD